MYIYIPYPQATEKLPYHRAREKLSFTTTRDTGGVTYWASRQGIAINIYQKLSTTFSAQEISIVYHTL